MDIVYILKSNWDDRELKYSLRSLKNLIFDNIFIVWDCPRWLKNINHIKADDPYKVKSLNALHKIKIACLDKRISDDFILMNDDFYILKQTEIKYWNRWTIKEHLAYREEKKQTESKYTQNLLKTLELFPNWYDFSLHLPIIYNKQKFLDMCDCYDMTQWYLLRNLYCNHYWIIWEIREDVKCYDKLEVKEWQDFLSSDDWIINDDFFKYMDSILWEKSKYEKVIKPRLEIFNYRIHNRLIEQWKIEDAQEYLDNCR
jgi:hypothetical protein